MVVLVRLCVCGHAIPCHFQYLRARVDVVRHHVACFVGAVRACVTLRAAQQVARFSIVLAYQCFKQALVLILEVAGVLVHQVLVETELSRFA